MATVANVAIDVTDAALTRVCQTLEQVKKAHVRYLIKVTAGDAAVLVRECEARDWYYERRFDDDDGNQEWEYAVIQEPGKTHHYLIPIKLLNAKNITVICESAAKYLKQCNEMYARQEKAIDRIESM